MLDYNRHDPKGWCGDPKRGAAMGRPRVADEPPDYKGTIFVSYVHLDGDYDRNGTYFGAARHGEALWWIANEEGTIDYIVRTRSMFAVAESEARAAYPNATIVRGLDVSKYDTLDVFTCAYIDTMLFSSTDQSRDDGGDPLDEHYSEVDLAPEARAKIVADCVRFQAENAEDIRGALAHAGRAFWYTRNGHGCGFWDGDWEEPYAARLTAAAKRFGEIHPYIGDDEKIHLDREHER